MGVFFIRYLNLALNKFFSYLAQIHNPKSLVGADLTRFWVIRKCKMYIIT